jgi:hypothetical protein
MKPFENLLLEFKKIAIYPNKFKQTLREFLNTHSFYALEEFHNIYYTCLKKGGSDYSYFQGLVVFRCSELF